MLKAQCTNGQVNTNVVDTLLQWDAPSINTAQLLESTNNIFTATLPGLYMCQYMCSGDASGNLTQYVYKNGSEATPPLSTYNPSTFTYGWGAEFWIDLQVGDTLSFYINAPQSTFATDSTHNLLIYLF